MTEQKTIKRQYSIKPFIITNDAINQFEIIPNRRLISPKQVRTICRTLVEGKNPIGILIINKRNDKMRLIDGNHRLEAVKVYYSYMKNPQTVKIECILKIFENLTDDEERQVYSDEAKRRNESFEDRLNMYKDTLQFWKNIQDSRNDFPCEVSIYKQAKSVRFRLLLDSLATTKDSSLGTYSPMSPRKENIIRFALSLDWDDFLLIKEYMKFFQMNFGAITKDNIYLRTQIFMPLFDIWAKNRELVDAEALSRRFRRVINKPDVIQFAQMNCREVNIKMRKIMIDYMNFGTSINQFR